MGRVHPLGAIAFFKVQNGAATYFVGVFWRFRVGVADLLIVKNGVFRLGAALISQTCDRARQLSLTSYDRFFPNQDTLPKGGFGNLIALPLQKKPRENGCSVFVDEQLKPFDDQWAYLKSVGKMNTQEVEAAIFQITGQSHPLDVAFVTAEEESAPWKRPPRDDQIVGPLPEIVPLTPKQMKEEMENADFIRFAWTKEFILRPSEQLLVERARAWLLEETA